MATAELPISNQATARSNKTSLRTAALVAGIGLLIMVFAAPFSELFVFPRLVIPGDAAETARNILENRALFTSAVLGYLITFICDVLVAWALYVFLKPVQEDLSLLTAWFRLVYTVIAIVALLNLVSVVKLVSKSDVFSGPQRDSLSAQIMLLLDTFKSHWNIGLLFFGLHLILLGVLCFQASYIPKIVAGLVLLAGLGYLVSSLRPFFPGAAMDLAQFTFFGEIVFMLWLLIKGRRIKEVGTL